jgi:hypothetical protein
MSNRVHLVARQQRKRSSRLRRAPTFEQKPVTVPNSLIAAGGFAGDCAFRVDARRAGRPSRAENSLRQCEKPQLHSCRDGAPTKFSVKMAYEPQGLGCATSRGTDRKESQCTHASNCDCPISRGRPRSTYDSRQIRPSRHDQTRRSGALRYRSRPFPPLSPTKSIIECAPSTVVDCRWRRNPCA